MQGLHDWRKQHGVRHEWTCWTPQLYGNHRQSRFWDRIGRLGVRRCHDRPAFACKDASVSPGTPVHSVHFACLNSAVQCFPPLVGDKDCTRPGQHLTKLMAEALARPRSPQKAEPLLGVLQKAPNSSSHSLAKDSQAQLSGPTAKTALSFWHS